MKDYSPNKRATAVLFIRDFYDISAVNSSCNSLRCNSCQYPRETRQWFPRTQYNKSYLLKLGTSRNQSKRAETSRKQPQRPKKLEKRQETTQNVKIGQIWNFLLVFVFQILSPNTQIKSISINFLILRKFYLY